MSWVLPSAGFVISGFGHRVLEGAISNFHEGVDVTAKRGPVFAANDGVVNKLFETSRGAWVLDIAHPDEDRHKIRTRYIHMLREEIRVDVGDRVTRGQWIGKSGTSGTKAAHLHFEVMVDGDQVNPVPFLAMRGLTFDVSPVPQILEGVGVPPARAALMALEPEDDMTPEQENMLKHAVAMATESRNLAAHLIVVLSNLPAATATATMWGMSVARQVDGVDTQVPVIQEIADAKTQLFGLAPARLDRTMQDVAPLVLPDMSATDLDAIGEVIANEHNRRVQP